MSTCACRPRCTALPRPSAPPAATSCSSASGLTEAADRKVGGYSGGMKRRLDLALALVHGPRILFLDEPTTGLDVPEPQRRCGTRSRAWPGDDGVTVFLTTQYLEEADVLADRVGIIDHGRIVAEGTPTALKAEIGRPTVEAIPPDPPTAALSPVLERFGERSVGVAQGRVRAAAGRRVDLADVVRALDAEGLAVADLQLHAPTLDDVFLAKTGRSLEGAGDEDEAVTAPRRGGVAA